MISESPLIIPYLAAVNLTRLILVLALGLDSQEYHHYHTANDKQEPGHGVHQLFALVITFIGKIRFIENPGSCHG